MMLSRARFICTCVPNEAEPRSWVNVVMAMRQPSLSWPTSCCLGTRTFSKNTSLNSAPPVIWRNGLTVIPGLCISTSKKLMPLCLGACGSVRVSRIHISATCAIRLWPVKAGPAGIELFFLPGPLIVKCTLRVTRHRLPGDGGCKPGPLLLPKCLGGVVKTHIHTPLLVPMQRLPQGEPARYAPAPHSQPKGIIDAIAYLS